MRFRKLAYPYIIWISIFIIIPIIMVLYYALKSGEIAGFTLDNFIKFFKSINLRVFYNSIKIAFVCTIVCLIIGYPMAYWISKLSLRKRSIMILLVILPMWMNFLLRTYAWMNILATNGIINNFLGLFGMEPLNLIYTKGAIIVGMVYNFLPFMILPIYTVIEKIDNSLLEASADLGATQMQTFWKIIFPMSLPGVITGITMVFIPAISTFEISALLGGNKINLIGNVIENQFRVVGDWNYGSAISMVLMAIILIIMMITNKFDSSEEKTGGGLW
ncbi:ABC transporter permease [Miniphocaeibacter halophilus]|uniref:ABC transporter permease n=1 Tax=Miniphocaeibacter halophilus TaxID=2931922 RepID=A0AC61MSK1_9FIRM|nr:ABC transporter permease [Miniphocaeibacter halophilus]QQK07444.1 ABC transporter permease [Miniphocaeibacter halophilus]